MPQINPYLLFDGKCEEAFKFYEETLGGKIEFMLRNADSPMSARTPADLQNKILHARLSVGGGVLMGSDAPPERYEEPKGNWVSLNVEEPDESEQIFRALAENGRVVMPIEETFWAQRFGMAIDRFGIPWMVNCEKGG